MSGTEVQFTTEMLDAAERQVTEYIGMANESQIALTEVLAQLYEHHAWQTRGMTLADYWSKRLGIGTRDANGDVSGFVLSKPACIALIKRLPKVPGRDMSTMTGVASASVKRYRKEAGVISATKSAAQPDAGTSTRTPAGTKRGPNNSPRTKPSKAKSKATRANELLHSGSEGSGRVGTGATTTETPAEAKPQTLAEILTAFTADEIADALFANGMVSDVTMAIQLRAFAAAQNVPAQSEPADELAARREPAKASA